MKRLLQEAVLPNGRKVYGLPEKSAAVINEQVHLYFRHGIRVEPGATVFDVGANIGLFTLLADEFCRHDADIFAFEPIPASREALCKNVDALASDRVRVLPCALGATAGSESFAYYPRHSTLSTAYHSDADERELHAQLSESILRNLDAAPPPLRWFRWLPSFINAPLISRIMQRSMKDVEEVRCEIRTFSEIVREYDIKRIDLLKVDVEKAELDVLEGIDETDWPKVQQVVMEVHDINGRLKTITDLLKAHGITSVIAEQEPVLRGSNVYTLYAARSPLSS